MTVLGRARIHSAHKRANVYKLEHSSMLVDLVDKNNEAINEGRHKKWLICKRHQKSGWIPGIWQQQQQIKHINIR